MYIEDLLKADPKNLKSIYKIMYIKRRVNMLKERMDILQQASVISQEVSDYVKQVIDLLEPSFSEKESVMEMFTTHLAMATQRILNQDEVEQLDDCIWNDVLKSPCYDFAEQTFKMIENLAPCKFPEGEKRFLMMHLCNLHQ